jgi:hypothetical protein
MSLAALLLSAVLAQELGPERELEHYDFAIGRPAGWKATAMVPPIVEKYTSPEGAEIELGILDWSYPSDTKTLFEAGRSNLVRDLADPKELESRELVAGGRPARIMAYEGASRAGTKVVVARAMVAHGMRQHIFLVGRAPHGEAGKALLAMMARMLSSVRFGLSLEKAEEEALAKLPELPLDVIAGEEYARIVVSMRKIGWQRFTLRMEKLDDVLAIGWDYEIALTFDNAARIVTKSRGAMTRDGRQQRAEVTIEVDKDGKPVVHRETIGIRDGEATVAREVDGVRSESRFKVPPRTYLSEAAEILRRLLVRHQPGVYAFRRLEAFQDDPVLDVVEFAAAERGGAAGKGQRTIAMLAKEARVRLHHYHYGEDGAFYRATSARGAYMVERCSKDEALK